MKAWRWIALAAGAMAVIKDGTIKGVDVPAIIGAAHTLLGSRPRLERQAQAGARTDFSELSASFLIKAGVAHSENLQVTSPLLRITARGDVDIAAGTLDYAAKATLTAAATAGLGGKTLARLAGVGVPVRATGSLASPTYTVDVQSLAGETARDVLQREIERRAGGEKSGGQQGSGAVRDILRDLFGKPK